MASGRISKLALMSIHPKYAEAIFDGTKRVEFRKRKLDESVTHVVVYATAPISAVIGVFAIRAQQAKSPSALWRTYRSVGGIDSGSFFSYFEGHSMGVAIEIDKPKRNRYPITLKELGDIQAPPQSYQYLDSSFLLRLKKLGSIAA